METQQPTKDTYAVIYASAGCIPDSEYPEFVGTYRECEQFINDYADEYARPDVEHDLYSLDIVEVEDEEIFA
jgi:hypothetical protein